jgi:4-diphosphocytidyl-2-C-methyl-D-erythritol kinase
MSTLVQTAPAKLNLALVVGPLREDGKHEVVTLLAPLELSDKIELDPAEALAIEGFPGDTLVREALESLAHTARVEPAWRVTIEKQIPVAAGLGGGSSDAAAALTLANGTLAERLAREALHALAAELGADVPFFLSPGAKLGRGDGTVLEPVSLPGEFTVLLFIPRGDTKTSTAAVYDGFDARGGERGFEGRVAALEEALDPLDLRRLPRNDLASSPHSRTLEQLGAVRADVTGAGPAVYGLFREPALAEEAMHAVEALGWVWVGKLRW